MAKGRVIGLNNPPSQVQILFAVLCDSGINIELMIQKICNQVNRKEGEVFTQQMIVFKEYLKKANLGDINTDIATELLDHILCCECENNDCSDGPSSDPNDPASSYGCVYFFETRTAKIGWFVINTNNENEEEYEYLNLNINRCIYEQQDFEYPKLIPGSFEGSCQECLEQLELE